MGKSIIRILQPGDEAALEAFLLPRLDSSMFLIGNMRASGLIDIGHPYAGTYAAAFEGEKITAVAAHYWNQVLVFQAPEHIDLLWPEAVRASKRPIAGLIGPDEQVMRVKEDLEIKNSVIKMDEAEQLFSLNLADLIEPEALTRGEVRGRRIVTSDLDLITRWRVAYTIEALGDQESPELWNDSRTAIQRSLDEGRTWILEDNGQPVACSSFNTVISEAVQVGGVWTPPELRGRGYGRCVVAASLSTARAEGVEKAILFTGVTNLAAQKAYIVLGFKLRGGYRVTLMHPPITL
ncbi:GNAT family N-acetyltransferase [candidate division CSSED10-310 bacterium]|uniref:GNAT family N-acetyltransferase n=1 Tax=candidate division CSSED10-310 bacterium TaxID=2855610 RepID=A0ABV6Z0B3_UNCC1